MTPRQPLGLAGAPSGPIASQHPATGFPEHSGAQGQIWTARLASRRIPASGLAAVRITVGYPRFRLAYRITATVRELAPARAMLAIRSDAEYTHLYRERLDAVGVGRLQVIFDGIRRAAGADPVLLCYEDVRKSDVLCHRRLFAAWWEERTGEPVLELSEDEREVVPVIE